MKNTMKKLLSLVLVAMLLVCAVPFQAAATEADETLTVKTYVDGKYVTDKYVTVKPGQKLELTKNEFKILQMLLENTGKIVSRESIMTRLWDSNEFIDDNTLTVNVARLRKKMEQIGLGGKIITKKGIGYMVEA